MTEPLKPTGFWSYTSSDDTASRGRLSQLRRLLADELQLKIGRVPQVHIFQDVAAIPHGADWLKEIHKALADSSFFIPIVTPAFLQSEMCCQEVLHFREREAALGRDDLIFPLHYLSVDDVDPHRPSECHDAAVLELLRSRQWIDFRSLRFRDPNGEDVALKLEALAGSIRAALRRGGTTVTQATAVPSPRDPGLEQAERNAGPSLPRAVAGAWAAGLVDAPAAAAVGATDATVPAGVASARPHPAGAESSPRSVAASAVREPDTAAARPSWRRAAAQSIATAVVLLLIGTFGFLQQRAPPSPTAQPEMPQPAQPAAPPAAKPQATNSSATPVPGVAGEPTAGSVTRDCATCPELVLIPPGSFVMGVPPEEDDREGVAHSFDEDARPQHKVTIARAFWLGRYPVTRGEYAAFVQDAGYKGGADWRDPGFPQTDRDPVVNVIATDAAQYVAWLSRKTGKSYRLPSEAEWEYAARAGTTTARFWGDDRDRTSACGYANVADEALRKRTQDKPDQSRYFACGDGYAYTSPAGTFRPNGFGLYDMLGNVWQWTADCFNNDYSNAPGDGSARTTGDCGTRVLRGGSWYADPKYLRAGVRLGVGSDSGGHYAGFRIARTL